MKTKLYFFALILFCIGFSLSSCSSDTSEVPEVSKPILVLDKTDVNIKFVNGQLENNDRIRILSGDNSYSILSLNKAIVNAVYDKEVNEIIVSATGQDYGFTKVIIVDEDLEVATINVMVSEFDDIKVDSENDKIIFNVKYGYTDSRILNIIEGNGDYKVKSSDENLISVKPSENNSFIISTVEAQQDFETSVIITDNCNISKQIPIILKTTIIPYDIAKENEISDRTYNKESQVLEFSKRVATDFNYGFINTIEGDYRVFGAKEIDSYWGPGTSEIKIFVPLIDLKEGELDNISMSCISFGSMSTEENIYFDYFKILKIDEDAIRAVYAYKDTMTQQLQYGYFILSSSLSEEEK